MQKPLLFYAVMLGAIFQGCSAPRSVGLDAVATPKGHFAIGGETGFTAPTQTVRSLYGTLEDQVQDLANDQNDTVAISATELNQMVEALFAYSLDPMGARTEVWLRYGIGYDLDAGYRFASGAHAFDVRWQFLSPPQDTTKKASIKGWNGSLALQYCGQSYDLPSVAFLDKLQSILRYEFKRKDLLVPLIFGKTMGENGRLGSYNLGLVYNHTWITYGSEILNLVEKLDENTVRPFKDLNGEASIPSYGAFTNVRLGWSRVFLVGALAVYYQNYGKFELFGEETVELKGWTILPSLGLELKL
jgi:hypothetical protein